MSSLFGSRKYLYTQTANRLSFKTVIFFLISLLLCFSLISVTVKRKLNMDKMDMERTLSAKSTRIKDVLSRLLNKTQTVAALVMQGDTETDIFERVASMIIDDPAILNILVAPSGVVASVYPLANNEAVLGYDLLRSGPGDKEAVMAKDSGKLVLGGPFPLIQGGQGLVGRMPMWSETPDGERKFDGFVSILLKFPEALSEIKLDALEEQGFSYELWRINPDTGIRQTILGSSYSGSGDGQGEPYLEERIDIFNASWYLRIFPIRTWYQYPEHWGLIIVGLSISLLVAFIVQKNHILKRVTAQLEYMLHRDPLTEVFNRDGLFHQLELLIRPRKKFYLYYMDLNYFKQINDTYGHNVGDRVLTEFTRRIQKHLGDNHIFARISGDEFVLVRVGLPAFADEEDLFWENIHREFEGAIFQADGDDIHLSFSRGLAIFPIDGDTIDGLISRADKKMYQQKHSEYDVKKRRRASDLKEYPGQSA